MPTTRKMVKRDLDQVIGNLETAEDYLTRSGRLYETTHPDIYDKFCGLLTISTLFKEAVGKLRDEL